MVGDGRGDLELEIDDRRAEELGAFDSAQDLGRALVETDIFVAGPDSPLASVDRLADLEAGAVGRESLTEFLHRGPPTVQIGDQVAGLRQGEDKLVPPPVELACELFLGVVIGLPGMEAKENFLHCQRLDRPQVLLGIIGPRPHAEPDAIDGHRLGVELALERTVP